MFLTALLTAPISGKKRNNEERSSEHTLEPGRVSKFPDHIQSWYKAGAPSLESK